MEASPKTAPISGGMPTNAIDCGDGYYISQSVEPIGEPRYCTCSPDGQRRYSNDLWQAEIYIHQMKDAAANLAESQS